MLCLFFNCPKRKRKIKVLANATLASIFNQGESEESLTNLFLEFRTGNVTDWKVDSSLLDCHLSLEAQRGCQFLETELEYKV
mgnify:CR=1 FL=1